MPTLPPDGRYRSCLVPRWVLGGFREDHLSDPRYGRGIFSAESG